MEVKINIKCDNAAFTDDPGYEVARILRKAADKIEHNLEDVGLMDVNGNRVGKLEVQED